MKYTISKLLGLAVALCTMLGMANAQVVATGIVVDKTTNQPVAGAVVTHKSSKKDVVTNDFGEFSVQTKNSKRTFKVSCVGFETEEIAVEDLSQPLFFALTPEIDVLTETVVIGYGKATKDKLTGSINTIRGEVVEQSAITNVLEALQGRVAGMTVDLANGIPGAETTIQVRGLNTLTANTGGCCQNREMTYSEPLVLVDGVPYHSKSVSTLGLGAVGEINPISLLNPADVERIEILKDADATAIYGSRGSNGVILITTKKGI